VGSGGFSQTRMTIDSVPPTRSSRRRPPKRKPSGRWRLLAGVFVVACCVGLTVYLLSRESPDRTPKAVPFATGPGSSAPAHPHPAGARRVRLVSVGSGALPAAIQDAAAAEAGRGRVVLAGGLTASDVSTDVITGVGQRNARVVGRLPFAVHDSAAVRLGGAVYLFGGGDATGQRAEIVRVDLRTGAARVVGRLPAPSSDQAAVAVGGTAYVVGGFTGARWLDTIVAWRPRAGSRVVGRLPFAVRYAAVAAAGKRFVIAGGSLQSGEASRAVLEFVPASGRVVRVGTLPAPTTHAAAAALGSTVYVVGGRGGALGTPTSRIVAVTSTGHVVAAGRLPEPLSDLAAVATGRRILVAGGRSRSGTVSSFTWLRHTTVRVSVTPRRAAVPRQINAANVYAADGPGMLRGAARLARPLIYVPNSGSDTVDVIDPSTYRIVEHFSVGGLPQHVVPAYDLKTLYVTNDTGNSLTTIDPRTGKPGRTIRVADPYNMYFTPDGRYAIVVAERLARLDFRDAHSFRLHNSLHVPCSGVDHMDFSADGSYLIASCEFSSQLIKVAVNSQRVVGTLQLPAGASPQDVKLSPDGKVFYVADKAGGGVWEIDGLHLRRLGFLHTGSGAHGLYPSRDARYLYVTNRTAGSISVVSFHTRKVVRLWRIPGGGSPDMGGVSNNGKVLWLSGRYNNEVYAISTSDGRLLARIKVGVGPHGLCVWPQPGRYSLGHTGILR
jgi:YVTN family beta-propeller protein